MICNLLWSRSFLDMDPRVIEISKLRSWFSQKSHCAYESEVLCGASMLRGYKILCVKSG